MIATTPRASKDCGSPSGKATSVLQPATFGAGACCAPSDEAAAAAGSSSESSATSKTSRVASCSVIGALMRSKYTRHRHINRPSTNTESNKGCEVFDVRASLCDVIVSGIGCLAFVVLLVLFVCVPNYLFVSGSAFFVCFPRQTPVKLAFRKLQKHKVFAVSEKSVLPAFTGEKQKMPNRKQTNN
jgi:hypothetical protein